MFNQQAKGELSVNAKVSLSQKVSKGVVWVTAADICSKILNLTSAIILARLLDPQDFGLMATAMAVISFSQGTTITGFDSALIQRQDRPEDFLNVAWTIEFIRCFILFLILFLAAPLFSIFFDEFRITGVLKIIALSFIFQGLRNIGVIYFKKNLDFSKQFVLEAAPMLVNIITVVPLAVILKNIWALVWANLISSIASCLISYLLHPYRPRLDFEIQKFKELFNFGKWILGASIIVILREQGITMLIGKIFGMSILGFYNRAGIFSAALFQQLNEIVWKVGYPTYSQLQSDHVKLKQIFMNTLQILTFVGMPMAGGLFVLGRDFTILFLTEKWISIVPLLQIFSLQALITFINTPASILFQASGRPFINVKISVFGLIILIIMVYPLSMRWGVIGAMYSLFLSILLVSPAIWLKAIKIAGCDYFEFSKPILISLANTIIMMSIIYIIKEFLFIQVGFIQFFILIIVGIAVYCFVAYLFERFLDYDIFASVKERVVALR